MEQTLFRVKNLEQLIQKHGEDAFISQTILKMLAYEVQKYKEQIKRLDKALRKFERTYEKESVVFLQEFAEGWAMIKEGKAAVRSRIVDGHYITEARNETG